MFKRLNGFTSITNAWNQTQAGASEEERTVDGSSTIRSALANGGHGGASAGWAMNNTIRILRRELSGS